MRARPQNWIYGAPAGSFHAFVRNQVWMIV